jgi:hypothetical protein
MKTRCKFKCDSTGEAQWSKTTPKNFTAKLSPVYGDSEENKNFWEATPGGNIEILCAKFQPFEVGKEYYVDFSPVESDPSDLCSPVSVEVNGCMKPEDLGAVIGGVRE